MSVVACPACDSTHVSWSTLADHLWSVHSPFDHPSDSATCPECEYPLTRGNIVYHLACFTECSPATLWTGLPTDGRLCPICGQVFEGLDRAVDHIMTHAGTDQKTLLGGELSCTVCGEEPHPDYRFRNHFDCLVNHLPVSYENGEEYRCPYCEEETTNEGELEWHIWLAHFETNGFIGRCDGCGEQFSFGSLKQHLLCNDAVHGPNAAQLFDLDIRECFLCDLSVRNPGALRRHMSSHLSSIEILGDCTECGEPINEQNIMLHYPCLANAAGADAVLDNQPSWLCPLCNHTTHSQENFVSHLGSSHDIDLFEADECCICDQSLTNISNHQSCLLSLVDPDGSTNPNFQVPAVLLNRPTQTENQPTEPLPKSGQSDFYRNLKQFVEQEQQSAQDEAWRRYETIPLDRLKYKENVILDLVSLGTQSNPHVDLQFTFERPVPEHEHEPDDLTTRFGIYPRQKVIVGAGSDLTALPMEAEVTFVDDQTIGITPEPERSYQKSELQSALANDHTTYHLVHLLNTTPYDRKRNAISAVQDSSSIDSIITGETPISEWSRNIGSFYAGQLNAQQKQAVGRALGDPAVCCIHGPPGTGKTRTLTAIIELAVARGDRVLACAHSNQAIDNLLVGTSTLDDPEDSSLHSLVTEQQAVTMARVGHHSEHSVVQTNYIGVEPDDADIVGATTSAAAELEPDSFDLVIVDEATQADQPATFIPLLRGDHLVLAGDHKQLPPFCSDETAREEDMHISLFEHLLNIYDEQLATRLDRQYRMNQNIAEFSSNEFYDGSLRHGEGNRNWQIADLKPCVGHHIVSHEQTRDESKSKYNPGEAELVAQQVRLLQIHDITPAEIGIITAYAAQINEIASALKREDIDQPEEIKIDTIDSFQGSEREAIIVSLVRSNSYNASGFLTFPDEGKRRLNVALTRAKKRLVVIGDFETLGSIGENRTPEESCAEVYANLYNHLDQNGWLKNHN